MKLSYMVVTPEMAAEWLTKGTHNRKLRPRGASTYANEIRQGRWRCHHQGLAFDVDDRLVDGQHRLQAIMEANIPVPMVVAFGLPRGSMEAVDRGMKRTIPDILRLEHAVLASNRVSSLVTVIAGALHNYELVLTPAEVLHLYRQYQPAIDWAVALPGRGKLWGAPIVAAFALAWRNPTHRAAVLEFVARYDDGVGIGHGQPVYYLRRAVAQTERAARMHPYSRFQWVLNVLHAHVLGRAVQIEKGVAIRDKAGCDFFLTHQSEKGGAA